MGDFFSDLKRRNIYRVTAGYAVVAWVLLQLVTNVTPLMDAPLWVGQFCLLLLVLGFPLAIFLAWTRELPPTETASAIKATATDWTLIGALAIVFAAISYQQLAPENSGAERQEASIASARSASLNPGSAISLAVLPFANLSGDASQEFFSDGMTEEITSALAKVPDLRVVARTSAFEFKNKNLNITAQLIKADDGTHIWAEDYDRELTDVFAIQEGIARAITAALRMPLGLKPGENLVNNRAIDPDSYQQFLRGKAALLRARNAYLDQLALLEPVVQKNPNYAPAWAAVAQAYRYAAAFARYSTPEEGRRMRATYEQKMTEAAQRAIALDPDFVDGKVMLARIQSGPRRLILAEDIMRTALATDPNHPGALDYYSSMLVLVGRIKEGLAMKQQVHGLEPYAPAYTGNLAQALWQDGQTDAAIALWNENWDAQGAGAGPGLARIYASQGKYEDAAAQGDRALSQLRNQSLRTVISDFARLMRTAPEKADAPEKLPRLADLSFVYLYIGAPERALELFEEDNRTLNDLSLLFHSSYAPVRKMERFKKIVRDAGLIDYWRERGWPSYCRPVGADDFECD
jgi:adenylate cyclase